MSGDTGEGEMGLHKILEFIRFGSVIILLLHLYYFCYDAFKEWKLTTKISDRFLINIEHTGLFNTNNAQLFALGLLIISLVGAKGRKDEKIKKEFIVCYLLAGSVLYFFNYLSLNMDARLQTIAITYITATSLGYLLILAGGAQLSRLIKIKLGTDVFNEM